MESASGYRRALAVAGIFTLAAGDFWRYLLSWWGWGAIVAVLLTLVIIELVRLRPDPRRFPGLLLLTLALMALSVAWSAYRLETVAGVVLTLAATVFGVFLATGFGWGGLADALDHAVRWILGLSLVFELVVATIVRAPVLPLWVDYSDLDKIPRAFYWSRDLLLDGGRIQGIVGNANLLAYAALLGLVAIGVRLAAGRGSRAGLVAWALVALGTLALTRSTTVLAALVGAALVAGVVLLTRRSRGAGRIAVPVAAGVLAAAGVGLVVVFRGPLLGLLGRSSDLTNRLDIWAEVVALGAERPVAGWGWIGYWAPWTPPFDDLAVFGGVTYLQAHNAWLDVFLQLGVIGLVVVGVFVLATVVRAWLFSLEGPRGLAYLPVVLLAALLVHSLAESRLLIEIGWALLVAVAVGTSRRPRRPGVLP